MSLWVFKSYLTESGEHGRDVIDDWYNSLPIKAQVKFRIVLENLRDRPLPWPLVLSKPLEQGISELRFQVNRILYRPLGFFGPDNGEFTLVMPAREQGDEFIPRNALQTAIERKNVVQNDKERAHECGL